MCSKKPKIEVLPNPQELTILKIGWYLVLINFLLVFVFYFYLPDTIPTHYNLYGDADDFGSKSNIWVLPILNLILFYTLTFVIKKIKPWQMGYPIKVTDTNAPTLYHLNLKMLVSLTFGISVVFFIISIETILFALNSSMIEFRFIIPVLFLFLTILPFYFIFKMYKLPQS